MKLIQNKGALTACLFLALLGGSAPSVWAAPMELAQPAPTLRVTGTVTDETGEPLIGANVVVKGQTKGVNTDIDGNFSLDVEEGQTLVVSYIGCLPQEVVVKDAGPLNIVLKENATVLEEVVAIGYGVQKKKLVTGATVQVKGDDVAKMNTTNVLTAMQSTSPGVQITQSSSQPGKGFKVSIRGMGTIGDSSPLLIIDGINSGTADDGLNGLNPNDIESIDILKDAASCAIYGARAANGVILVTTKQGTSGKVSIQYDAHFGWSNAYRVPGTLNAQQYMQIVNESNFNTYGTAVNWPSLVPQSILDQVANGWEGTDWFDLYRNKNAFQMGHSLSLTGGNEVSKYQISVNYTTNNGIMGGDNASDYKRYGGRINSEHIVVKGKDHNYLTLGENLSYWYNSSHDLPESNGYWNIMQNVYSASPLVPAYSEDGSVGSYTNDGAGFSTDIYSNPLNGFLNGQYNSLNRSRNFGIGATFYWIIEPIKNLRYRGQINTGYSASNYRGVSMPFSASFTSASGSYGLNQSEYQSSSMTFENTITYVLPSFGKNNIDVMIGQSWERSNWSTGMSIEASDNAEAVNSLVLNGWDYAVLSNFSNIKGYSGYDNPKQGSIASFFGRINYNFDEKYLLTAIVRRDGSTNFAKGHRWGTFPSVSLGWVISNEKFLENATETMDFLKLRASWGQNGNCNIDNFYYLSNIGFSPTDYADYGYKFSSDMINTVSGSYTTGAYAKNVPNEDITWEKSEQWNVGLDARFLRSRLGVNLDFYIKKTKDWLVQAPLNDILGYEVAAYVNGGDVENKGVELAFSWNDRIGSDFNYHINVNAAYNHNEVTRLVTSSGKIGDDASSALFQNSSYVSLVEVGHPIGYFSGMDYSGVWQTKEQIDAARAAGQAVLSNAQPGDLIWIDYNGDGQITLDGDRHEIGDPNPDWTLGINLGANWKGWDFSVAGSGAFGQQIMQCYRTALLANQYLQYTTDVFDRWHGAGTSNTSPRLVVGSENNSWVSTYYMHNADYFKIQNITLGYDFTRIWKNSPFQTLRLYGQVQNLCTITGYKGVDPECGSNGGMTDANGNNLGWARGIDLGLYPTARTFLFGISIKY